MRLLKSFVLAAALIFAVSSTAQAEMCANPTAKVDSFNFLVDYSGSMMMKYRDGNVVSKEKIELAKDVLGSINSKLANLSYQGGLYTFAPFDAVLPEAPYAKDAMGKAIASLRSDHNTFNRMTPMGDGLRDMIPVAQKMPARSAIIVLSDGVSNRGSNPVEQARDLYASNSSTVLHIISFADTAEGKATLDQIARLNPGTVYVNGYELFSSEQALDKFISDVFYSCQEVLVLRSVQFALDSAALDATAKGILREAASMLKTTSGTIHVDGYTCNLGTPAYNQGLSVRRADSVRAYLIEHGIPANRIVAKGFGENDPKYSNATEETRRLNRRVEISIK